MANDKETPVDDNPDSAPENTPSDSAAKPAPKKRAAPRKKAASKKSSSSNEVAELKAVLQQNQARMESQEAKMAELMEGLEKTFGHIHKSSSEQTQKLSSLMIALEKTFHSLHTGLQSRDQSTSDSLDQVSETILRSSEVLRKEYEEMERLQEKKIESEKQRQNHRYRILKWMSVPAVILALVGIGHLFHTVTVMENAMTTMSDDMDAMRESMASMTGSMTSMDSSMGTMTHSMGEMNQNVGGMTQDVRGMRRDLGVMTYNVAPTMDGMRQMMPWAP